MLVLYIIEILPPLRQYKYDTWRIFLVKCYIDNFIMRLWSCLSNISRALGDEVSGVTALRAAPR
jgi:hypothetical protein